MREESQIKKNKKNKKYIYSYTAREVTYLNKTFDKVGVKDSRK